MGAVREAEYYDRLYKETEAYKIHYSRSFYLPLWMAALEHVGEFGQVLELGSGPGQFANLLADARPKIKYIGIDFCTRAVNMAQRLMLPESFKFRVADLRDLEMAKGEDMSQTTVICMETLEHLEDDLGLLRKFKGAKMILTVPSFDDPAHVRFFPTVDTVLNRYQDAIDIKDIEVISRWYLITT